MYQHDFKSCAYAILLFCALSYLLVPEHKNMNNLLANVYNLLIKFETRNNS